MNTGDKKSPNKNANLLFLLIFLKSGKSSYKIVLKKVKKCYSQQIIQNNKNFELVFKADKNTFYETSFCIDLQNIIINHLSPSHFKLLFLFQG